MLGKLILLENSTKLIEVRDALAQNACRVLHYSNRFNSFGFIQKINFRRVFWIFGSYRIVPRPPTGDWRHKRGAYGEYCRNDPL